MFQSDYRREMDRLAPSRSAMEKLEGLLAEGPAEEKRPRRRLGRRAAPVSYTHLTLPTTSRV